MAKTNFIRWQRVFECNGETFTASGYYPPGVNPGPDYCPCDSIVMGDTTLPPNTRTDAPSAERDKGDGNG